MVTKRIKDPRRVIFIDIFKFLNIENPLYL
jgi:hypothetical protein